MALSFENLSGNIEISNLRIAPNQSPVMMIADKPISEIKTIIYGSGDKTVSSSFFMSESDFVATYRSAAYNLITHDNGVFELTACGGTVRYANVRYLKVVFNDDTEARLTLLDGNANYSFVQETPDKKAKTVTSFKYLADRIVQTTGAYYDGAAKSSERVEADLFGVIIKRKDEYGVETEYFYDNPDNYDSPTRVSVTGADGKTLTQAYEFSPNNPSQKDEYISKVIGNDTSTLYDYYDPRGMIKSTSKQGGWTLLGLQVFTMQKLF